MNLATNVHRLFVFTVVAVATTPYAFAQSEDNPTPVPGTDSAWYYEIGGARALRPPAGKKIVHIPIDASFGISYSCGKFQFEASMEGLIRRLRSKADAAVQMMFTAVTEWIFAMAAVELQRAFPGAYDFLMNSLLRFEEEIAITMKSCEQMEYELGQDKDPYRELITVSKGNDWKAIMGSGGLDVIAAKDEVAEINGKNGVPWIGGDKGGNNQEPIAVVADVVAAGYDVTTGRTGGATGDGEGGHLVAVWPGVDDATDWAVQVLGDRHMRTCDEDEGCESPSGVPGNGVMPEHDEHRLALEEAIQALVDADAPPTPVELDAISASGIGISREVIDALRDLATNEQAIFVTKLAGEISQAEIIDKLLLLRRLLLAGRQVPEVAALEVAQRELDRKLAELDREFDNLLIDTRMRKEVVSNTVSTLLLMKRQRDRESGLIPATPYVDPWPITLDGAVRTREGEP